MRLDEIWRYPVKSMLGERLNEASVGPAGVEGDRQWAVVDASSGVSMSAKRYAALFQCRARTIDSDVIITMPNGNEYTAGSSEVAQQLSGLLKRDVETKRAQDLDTIQHEFPTAVTEGEGEPFLYDNKLGAFFDSVPLHLITTATLAKLRELLPKSDIRHSRFRPNFVVDIDGVGLVEISWIGKKVQIGQLGFDVTGPTKRCVMVTREQPDLPKDIDVIRTILKECDGSAGVALSATGTGTVAAGDVVTAVDDA